MVGITGLVISHSLLGSPWHSPVSVAPCRYHLVEYKACDLQRDVIASSG